MSPPAPSRRALIVAFASVYVAWGSTYFAIRIGIGHLPPTMLGGLRFLLAGGGMLGALAATGRLAPTPARELRAIAVMAVAMLIGGNGLVMWAEQSVPSGLAALIVASTPVWMAACAALPPINERLPARGVIGIGLGLLGVALLCRPSLGGALGIWGMLGLLGASLSWTFGSLYSRRVGFTADPLTITGWEMLFAGVLFLAIAAVTGGLAATRLDAAGLGAVVYLATVGSWIGFTAYVWLLANVPAAKAVTYAYVNPVIALLLGWWFLDEPLTPAILAGCAIVIAGVALVTTARVSTPAPVDRSERAA